MTTVSMTAQQQIAMEKKVQFLKTETSDFYNLKDAEDLLVSLQPPPVPGVGSVIQHHENSYNYTFHFESGSLMFKLIVCESLVMCSQFNKIFLLISSK